MSIVPDWLEKKAAQSVAKLRQKASTDLIEGTVITQTHETQPVKTNAYTGNIHLAKALVKAAHGLTIHQTRLIRYALSKIHQTAEQPSQVVVHIDALDYAQELDIVNGKNFYRDLQEAADNLFTRYISLMRETETGRVIDKIHWVSSTTYHTGEGWVEIRFSPEVSPLLTQLKMGDKIVYKLQSTANLRSVYSWRFFELIMQWQDTKKLYITLEDFKHALEIPDSYLYGDVKAHCINRSIKELREKANLDVKLKTIKSKTNKRKVSALEFTWKTIEQIEMKLEGGDAKAKPVRKKAQKT